MKARLQLLVLGVVMCFGTFPVASAVAATQVQPSVSRSAAVSGSAVVAEAQKYLGYPYAYTGGSPATGFSCIGFVWWVYHELGQDIPGTLGTAIAAFPRVSESQLLPGDIVFFQNTWWQGVSHVAIYIGGGKIIHAENPQNGVTISSISGDARDGDYWQQHYLVAERPWTGGAGTPPPAHHTAKYVYVQAAALNLRSGPSTEDSVLTVLQRGTKIRVEGWRPGWVRVRTASGTLGWVMRIGVSRTPISNPSTGRKTRHHHFNRAARKRAWSNSERVSAASLNVRSAPSLSAAVLTSVAHGTRLGILGTRSGWDHVILRSGGTGWALGQYLGATGPTRDRASKTPVSAGHTAVTGGINVHASPRISASVVAVTDGNPVHVLHWARKWVHVKLDNGAKGWIMRSLVGSRRHTPISRRHRTHHTSFRGGQAVAPGIRIHSKPSLSAAAIAGTTSGMRVKILGHRAGFAHVLTSTGVRGWIEASLLRGSGNTASRPTSGPYATASVRLHARPGINTRVIGMVYAGQHVVVLSESNGWARVRLANGVKGYVDAQYLAG